MKALLLAGRNLLRNRHRSLATVLTMMVGACAILLFGGFSRFITYGLQTAYVQYGGHFQIQKQGYFLYGSGNPAAFGIKDYRHVEQVIGRDPVMSGMVAAMTPTLDFNGIAGNAAQGVSRTVIARGVIVDEQNRFRSWNEHGLADLAHALPLTGSADNAAVIGNGLARVLQLCEPLKVPNCVKLAQPGAPQAGTSTPDDLQALAPGGDKEPAGAADTGIQLLASNLHGAPNVVDLDVVKTEQQGGKEWDDAYLIMHLKQAQQLLFGQDNPQVTGIALQLHHTDMMPQARARLEYLLAGSLRSEGLEVMDFMTIFPFYGQSVKMFDVIFVFIATLIGVVVVFTVSNGMRMAVVERTVEIGTLRAIGNRRSVISRIFVYEGLLLGCAGAVGGAILALVLAWTINHSGIMWNPPGQTTPILLTVRLWGETGLLASTAFALVCLSALSARWPARRAASMNIVEALRHI